MLSQEQQTNETPVEDDRDPKYCPYCGAQELKPAEGGFVEAGEYDGRGYEHEADANGYICGKCGQGFLDYQPQPYEEDDDDSSTDQP